MEDIKWHDASLVKLLAAVALLVIVAGLLAGCAGALRGDVQGVVCKPSELNCTPPQLLPGS